MFSKHPPFLWNKPSHLICNLSVFYYFYAINKTVTTMIYRFTIISDEVDDFVREIQIDPEATFFDLHEAILKAANYTNDQMTSFFICDDDWEKETEITLEDMGSGSSEEDTYIMRETPLSELLEDEKQKMIYVFDPLAERVFFIELSEIITGKDLDKAVCTRKNGEAPQQTIDFDEQMNTNAALDLDENFYGDQDYDMEDFDPEGFDINEGSGNPYDEDKY